MIEESKLQQRMKKIGDLVDQLNPEEAARSRELLESVMDLHGEALERILLRLRGAGEAGSEVIRGLSADPVVSSVLLLYGLHPEDFETRVRRAIESSGPALRPYGVYVELAGVSGGTVRIRFRGVDSAFTARTVKAAVEDQLYAAAPDAASVVFLGLEKFSAPDFVPLEMVASAEKA
jgi:hypothetical protein